MTTEELFLIFIIVEMIQMFLLVLSSWRTQKDINRLTHDPDFAGAILSNGIHGFIQELVDDPKKQESFFGLIQVIGQNIFAGAGGGTPNKPVKLKGFAKIFEPFINNQQIQGMIGQRLGGFLEKTGKAGVEKAAEAVTEGWA